MSYPEQSPQIVLTDQGYTIDGILISTEIITEIEVWSKNEQELKRIRHQYHLSTQQISAILAYAARYETEVDTVDERAIAKQAAHYLQALEGVHSPCWQEYFAPLVVFVISSVLLAREGVLALNAVTANNWFAITILIGVILVDLFYIIIQSQIEYCFRYQRVTSSPTLLTVGWVLEYEAIVEINISPYRDKGKIDLITNSEAYYQVHSQKSARKSGYYQIRGLKSIRKALASYEDKV